jgi:ribosomal protein S18 acetylase RimI-like enzyme
MTQSVELNFRLATASEISVLSGMIEDYHLFDHIPFEKTQVESVLSRLIDQPELGQPWFICLGSQIIGYIIITFGYSVEYLGKNAFIDELYLKSEYREKGYGQKAMQFGQEIARKLGLSALHLEAERDNTRALHVYRKMGFQDPDRVLMTYWVHGKK